MTKRIELPHVQVSKYGNLLAGTRVADIRDFHEIARRCNNWEKVREKLLFAMDLSIKGNNELAADVAEQALQIMEGEE